MNVGVSQMSWGRGRVRLRVQRPPRAGARRSLLVLGSCEPVSPRWLELTGRFPCAPQARQAELEAARLEKEKEEEEAKQVAQLAKKEKEIQKKAFKKERLKLRTTCKVDPHRRTL